MFLRNNYNSIIVYTYWYFNIVASDYNLRGTRRTEVHARYFCSVVVQSETIICGRQEGVFDAFFSKAAIPTLDE